METYRLVAKLILLVAVISIVAVVIIDSYMPDTFPVIEAAINSRVGKFGIGCALLYTSRYYSGFWFSYEDGVIMRALSFFTAPTLFVGGVIHLYIAAFGE
jgi:hypothetical protein